MDKKSKYITIFMCIVTLYALIIMTLFYIYDRTEVFRLPWLFYISRRYLSFVCSPTILILSYFKIPLASFFGFILFILQMTLTWIALLRFSKIENRLMRKLSCHFILIAYIFIWIITFILSVLYFRTKILYWHPAWFE